MEYKVKVTKKDKTIQYKVVSTYIAEDDYYLIKVYSPSGDVMGTLSYAYKNGTWNRTVWLNKIETYKKYQSLGVGTALIKVFEYEVLKSRCTFIDGKFYPDNEFAQPFYEKNGYTIERDWNDVSVCKFLDYSAEQIKELEKVVQPVSKEMEK